MLCACGGPKRPRGKAERRVIVVAFDGLDPTLTESLMRAGRLPNFSKLSAGGGYARLATCTPPQTPVAFASIISGAAPDFVHLCL